VLLVELIEGAAPSLFTNGVQCMKRLKQGKKLANGQRTYSGTEQGKRTQNE